MPCPARDRLRRGGHVRCGERDGRGGGDVERVDAAGHRDAHPLVGPGEGCVGQARPLGAEQHRPPGRHRYRAQGRRPRAASWPAAEARAPHRSSESGHGPPAPRTAAAARGPSTPARCAGRAGRRTCGSSSTASMPNAAALRNSAPRFSKSLSPSSTARRRAAEQDVRSVAGATRRRCEHAAGDAEADHVGQQPLVADVDGHVESASSGRSASIRFGTPITARIG